MSNALKVLINPSASEIISCKASSVFEPDFPSAASARLRSLVRGVFKSCAMLSDIETTPVFSFSMREIKPLKLVDNRSNSSPDPEMGRTLRKISGNYTLARLRKGIDVFSMLVDQQNTKATSPSTPLQPKIELKLSQRLCGIVPLPQYHDQRAILNFREE